MQKTRFTKGQFMAAIMKQEADIVVKKDLPGTGCSPDYFL